MTIVSESTARRSRWRAGLVTVTATAIAVVAGAGAVAEVPSASAAVVDTSASYVLVARHSGKVLNVAEQATADGAHIQQWARNDGAWQQWQFVDSGSGWYRLRSRHSGKALDVYNASTADGANVVQWPDHNGTNQQFRLADSDGGYVRLVNRKSGKAVEVAGASMSDGAAVQQRTDSGGTNQQWQLVKLGSGGTPPPSTPPSTPPPSYPDPARLTGSIGVHDPTVVKRPDGGYLVAHTGNGISLKTSTDRVAYRDAGAAFPGGAPWAHAYTNRSNHLWAPDLSYHDGQYYLYYSASTFGSNRSAIFLATSTTGAAGSWTNQGLVIDSSRGDNFNAIDPNLLVDGQGRWWLNFGSFWSGIRMIELDPATGKRRGTTNLLVAGRNGGAIEGPSIARHGDYYYLYVSFDICCKGASSTYRIMVGRSTSPTGPFLDRNGVAMANGGGTQLLAGHGSVRGPGHPTVIAETDGDVLFYHYYAASNGAALLGVNRLGYDAAGWPYVY